eukprot:scaffold27005_cov132-Isochrysis_galbana.AAC.3
MAYARDAAQGTMAHSPNTAPLAGFAGHVLRTAAGATNWLREANYNENAQKIVRGVSMCI